MSIIGLPYELVYSIGLKTDSRAITKLCQTNSAPRRLCANNDFWRDKLAHDFPYRVETQVPEAARPFYFKVADGYTELSTRLTEGSIEYTESSVRETLSANRYINLVQTTRYPVVFAPLWDDDPRADVEIYPDAMVRDMAMISETELTSDKLIFGRENNLYLASVAEVNETAFDAIAQGSYSLLDFEAAVEFVLSCQSKGFLDVSDFNDNDLLEVSATLGLAIRTNPV